MESLPSELRTVLGAQPEAPNKQLPAAANCGRMFHMDKHTKAEAKYRTILRDLAECVYENECDGSIENDEKPNFTLEHLQKQLDFLINEEKRSGASEYGFTAQNWRFARDQKRQEAMLKEVALSSKRAHWSVQRAQAAQKRREAKTAKCQQKYELTGHDCELTHCPCGTHDFENKFHRCETDDGVPEEVRRAERAAGWDPSP
jgi:hypothetical protein